MTNADWKIYIKRKARHGTTRTIIRRLRLIQLSEQQNHRCCYCGQDTWHPEIDDNNSVQHSKKKRATLEHVIAQTHGGGEGKHNLVMACNQCNNTRNDLPVEDFVTLIATYGANTPLSKRTRRMLRNEKRRNSEKGIVKARKTFGLAVIGALYFPELFNKAFEEVILHVIKTPKIKRKPLNSIGAIRKRVINNKMAYA